MAPFLAAVVVEVHQNCSSRRHTVDLPDSLDTRQECYLVARMYRYNHRELARKQGEVHNVHSLDQADHCMAPFVAGLGEVHLGEGQGVEDRFLLHLEFPFWDCTSGEMEDPLEAADIQPEPDRPALIFCLKSVRFLGLSGCLAAWEVSTVVAAVVRQPGTWSVRRKIR